MNLVHLAYSSINGDLANQLIRDLQPAGVQFERLTPDTQSPMGSFAERLSNTSEPVLLIITDNFLKDEQCMSGALSALRRLQQQRKLLLVVADGKESNDGGRTWHPVPTEYERMVNAIHYMNYWQDNYLKLIEKAQHAHDAPERGRIEAHMESVKDVSLEMGDFLNILRDTNPVHWDAFTNDRYAHFFRHFNLMDRHHLAPQPSPSASVESPSYASELFESTPDASGFIDLEEPMQAPPVHIAGPLAPQPAPEDPLLLPLMEEAQPAPHVEFPLHDDKPFFIDEEPPVTVPQPQQPAFIQYPKAETDQVILDARFWLERNHLERGLDVYRAAIDRQPQNAALRTAFLRALLEFAHDPDAANLQLEVLHGQGLPEVNSYELMGDIALERGDFLFAKYCWDRVAELQKEFPGIFRKLGLLTSEHLTEYKETAAHYLKLAIERKEANARVYHRLAALLWENGDKKDEALQLLQTTTLLDPDWAQAWLDLADASHQLHRQHEAASAYQKAIALQPDLQTAARDAAFAPPPPEPAPSEPEEVETETDAVKPLVPDGPVLTVLITGATSGIGHATAERFAREGHRVILVGRRVERLHELKDTIHNTYGNEAVHIIPLDVREREDVENALTNLPDAWKEIDVLINNAGLAKGLAPIHEGDYEHWETMIDTNIKGLLYVTRAVAPGMVARKKGHIINVGSSAGKEVYKNGNVYCATKFAVNALTLGMRLDLHEHNIRVGQVSPGHVEETEFALNRFDGDAEKARIYDDFQPLKASDVAEAIYFMVTRPEHVNIQDLWLFPSQQAASSVINRSGRSAG